jgi:hypothetical protein
METFRLHNTNINDDADIWEKLIIFHTHGYY